MEETLQEGYPFYILLEESESFSFMQDSWKIAFLENLAILRLVIAMWCLEKGVSSRGRPYGEIAVTKPPQGNLLQSFVTDVAWTGEIGEGGW